MRIICEHEDTGAGIDWVEERLDEANRRRAPGEDFRPFVLFACDDEDARQGGLFAFASWDWLVIDSLVVEPAARGRGIGAALVTEAERQGAALGCRRVKLETFQAEGFYRALGYTSCARLADYPPGAALVWMTKPLG